MIGDDVPNTAALEEARKTQRWYAYQYIAVRGFNYVERTELPSCVVAIIRDTYPSPHGEATLALQAPM